MDRKRRVGFYTRRTPDELDINQDYDSLCKQAFRGRFAEAGETETASYYLDICHQSDISQRPQLVRLLQNCVDGKVDIVVMDYTQRVAKNMMELIYLLYFLLHVEKPPEISILNCLSTEVSKCKKESILRVTEQIVSNQKVDYTHWENRILHGM